MCLEVPWDIFCITGVLNADFGTEAWATISEVPTDTTVRAMKILDQRCFTLRSAMHEQFEVIWKALIVVNMDDGVITINQTIPSMSASESLDSLLTGLSCSYDLIRGYNCSAGIQRSRQGGETAVGEPG